MIPVKWRITDANGVGISDPTTFVSIGSALGMLDRGRCRRGQGERHGSSGLQFDGNGNWQINWKTPKAYVGQCRTMYLNLTNVTPDTPTSETAHFQFK